jgi:hypothetical protein
MCINIRNTLKTDDNFLIYIYIYIYIYGSIALVGVGRFFSFLIDTQSVGLLGRRISPSQGHYLHTEQHKHRTNTQTSMPRVGFEPTIPVFERAKTVHASDRATTGIGDHCLGAYSFVNFFCGLLYVQHPVSGWQMNDELERFFEISGCGLEVLSRHLLEGTGKNHEQLQSSRCRGQNSNPEPPE